MSRWTVTQTADSTLLYRKGQKANWTVEVLRHLSCPATPNQRTRIAHQVRQDIWRAIQHVRGFLPLVEVSTSGNETVIRAGGSLTTRSGHIPTLEATMARVLDDKRNIARWLRHARRVKH